MYSPGTKTKMKRKKMLWKSRRKFLQGVGVVWATSKTYYVLQLSTKPIINKDVKLIKLHASLNNFKLMQINKIIDSYVH